MEEPESLLGSSSSSSSSSLLNASSAAADVAAELTAAGGGPSLHQRRAAYILEGWCLLVVGCVGVVGNLSAIVVFGRQRVQKNFHALMVTLAAFDLAYITVSAFIFSLPQFAPGFNTTRAYTHALPFVLPFAQIGLTGSIYLTCAVTLERYFTVCHPFYRSGI